MRSKVMIPVFEPLIGKSEKDAVLRALSSGVISGTVGDYVEKFEKGFSSYSECSYGVAVNSGTSALQVAVAALSVGKNDEVLVSSFTNMATFFAVLHRGAKPVPIDIEQDTWNLDPGLLEDKVNKRTKAIMPVHIYGHPVDMDPVLGVAKRHGLYVIEDAAEAHGALYKGRKVGSLGDFGCFSFYANKIITTGEGGMLTTNNSALAKKAKSLSNLAFGSESKFMHQDVGYKFLMSNILAAFGYAQLDRIEQTIERKRQVAKYYEDGLRLIPGLSLPVEKSYARNVYWMYHIVVDERKFGISRDRLMAFLAKAGVETRPSFVPYNMQEIFIKRRLVSRAECPVANYVGSHGLYIPSSPTLSERELDYIINQVLRAHEES